MPDPTDTSSNAKAKDDKKVLAHKTKKTHSDDKNDKLSKTPVGDKTIPTSKPLREQEPPATGAQAETFGRIQEISKEADLAAEREVRSALGEEARLAQGEPEIGPDLEDHGVRSPDKEASEVIYGGGVIELPITEEEYRQAEKAKIVAHVDEKKDVLGVSSIVALAMLVGRLLKKMHGHAMKIVFRKPSSASSFAKATDDKKATEGKGDGE